MTVVRRQAPSFTSHYVCRATSPVSLRYTGEEQDSAASLLTRVAGEGDCGCEADVVEGAQGRQLRTSEWAYAVAAWPLR